MANALDSAGWLNLSDAKAWGAIGVGLYAQSNLGRPQLEEAARVGIGIWSFYENSAADPNGGEGQGRRDAQEWARIADRIGQPQEVPVPADDDQIVPNLQVTIEYFAGYADELVRVIGRRAGFYGQTSIWEDIKGYGYTWFCKAPDGTRPPWPADADVIQSIQYPGIVLGGVNCDVDLIQKPQGFMWNADGLFLPKQPQPPEEDMVLTNVRVTIAANGLGTQNFPGIPYEKAGAVVLTSGAGADVNIQRWGIEPLQPAGTTVWVRGGPTGAVVTLKLESSP